MNKENIKLKDMEREFKRLKKEIENFDNEYDKTSEGRGFIYMLQTKWMEELKGEK